MNDVSDHSRAQVAPPEILADLAAKAGVCFNGSNPWDIQVLDAAVYRRILSQGSLGLGESYMDGLWECAALDELFTRLLSADIEQKLGGMARLKLLFEAIRQNIVNRQKRARAYEVGERHYDIGNEIFAAMLDPTMSYSCGYWVNADNLIEAQIAKLDLICRKLELKPGEKVLDIGCGWGGFARYAAEQYGVSVDGITVSKEQQQLAQKRCEGFPVTIKLQDYRELSGEYDKIVSIGMFEHVGPKNYPTFFDTALRLLKDDGLFLLHSIGLDRTTANGDPWIDKYIFPNGKIPSAAQLSKALDRRFIIEDWHNFGPDYDKTVMAWWKRFDDAWDKLSQNKLFQNYDQRFYRMWKYYLHCSAGFFRSKNGQLWQLVLAKRDRPGRYYSIR
ncbi:cyclopropane fatty acyl phospholipid synthase [Kangiella koreensis]|uniref:Cyclopropane-fatty-acyl-phospholipid synthase n=1 Tax=Kangiella koreensis (strain DSM 16069 / JCM 12317 / KCTC 12182 / SW-125) TaxID=523791 RepID=C7R9E4_KANKD|nr:cyclopropane fatty acyl phospholipid synthase [Kangiella koreensis]ACV26035.1 Cyclopropane-fatty-acyl-phospholipid synthase [Kangiella koreensis DSM 16069]